MLKQLEILLTHENILINILISHSNQYINLIILLIHKIYLTWQCVYVKEKKSKIRHNVNKIIKCSN